MITLTHGHGHHLMIRRWTFWVPIAMSLLVLLIVARDVGRFGFHAPHHDETGTDHIAMLLMFGQIPIMLSFICAKRASVRWRMAPFAAQVLLWTLVYMAARLT